MAAVKFKTWFTFELVDAQGQTAVMRVPSFTTSDTATVASYKTVSDALNTALGSPGTITNAKVVRRSLSFILDEASPTGALDAAFPSVADKATLTFGNAEGSRSLNSIPAPVDGIFMGSTNDDTVDPTTAVSAWISAYEAAAVDQGANALNLYISGVRRKSRAPRRRSHKP